MSLAVVTDTHTLSIAESAWEAESSQEDKSLRASKIALASCYSG